MKIYAGHHSINHELRGCAVAIGNFDGVHLAHQALLKKAVELAKQIDGRAVAYTFWPHPAVTLRTQVEKPKLIYSREQRKRLIASLGIESLVEESFSEAFSRISPENFVEQILVEELGAKAVVVGENYRFGYQAKGNAQLLRSILEEHGVQTAIVPPVVIDGELCSSSRVRELVSEGKIQEAANLLGRQFSLQGVVVHGAGRGGQIGFPTINLHTEQELLPGLGVYATQVKLAGSAKLYAGATNIGVRPTFDAGERVHIETHIPGFSGELYGQRIEVIFVKKIRDEKKFESVDVLKAQIALDIQIASDIISPN